MNRTHAWDNCECERGECWDMYAVGEKENKEARLRNPHVDALPYWWDSEMLQNMIDRIDAAIERKRAKGETA